MLLYTSRNKIPKAIPKKAILPAKINPINRVLPDKDIDHIKNRIIRNVKAELLSRVSRGYENIDLSSVEEVIAGVLRDMKISN